MDGDREILMRIAALEHKVNHLYNHLVGIEGQAAVVPPLPSRAEGISEAVMQHVRSGDKIQAIKQYRAETGVDLAVAKDVIDKL